MTVSFLKICCCQKGYLCPLSAATSEPARAARILCDRRAGAGGDGLLLFPGNAAGEQELICYSPAGEQIPAAREAVLAGAKFLYDTARVNLTELCLSESGNSHRLRLETCGGRAWGVTMDFGYPLLDAGRWAIGLSGLVREKPFPVGADRYLLSVVGFEAPVAVLFGGEHPPKELSPLLAHFPAGVSVLYLPAVGEHLMPQILIPSPGEDGACLGSAVVTAAAIAGRIDFGEPHPVTVSGIRYHVTVTPALRLFVTFDATEVLRGEIEL